MNNGFSQVLLELRSLRKHVQDLETKLKVREYKHARRSTFGHAGAAKDSELRRLASTPMRRSKWDASGGVPRGMAVSLEREVTPSVTAVDTREATQVGPSVIGLGLVRAAGVHAAGSDCETEVKPGPSDRQSLLHS